MCGCVGGRLLMMWQASCERLRGDWFALWRGVEMGMSGEVEKAAIEGLRSVSLPLGRCCEALSACFFLRKRVVPL